MLTLRGLSFAFLSLGLLSVHCVPFNINVLNNAMKQSANMPGSDIMTHVRNAESPNSLNQQDQMVNLFKDFLQWTQSSPTSVSVKSNTAKSTASQQNSIATNVASSSSIPKATNKNQPAPLTANANSASQGNQQGIILVQGKPVQMVGALNSNPQIQSVNNINHQQISQNNFQNSNNLQNQKLINSNLQGAKTGSTISTASNAQATQKNQIQNFQVNGQQSTFWAQENKAGPTAASTARQTNVPLGTNYENVFPLFEFAKRMGFGNNGASSSVTKGQQLLNNANTNAMNNVMTNVANLQNVNNLNQQKQITQQGTTNQLTTNINNGQTMAVQGNNFGSNSNQATFNQAVQNKAIGIQEMINQAKTNQVQINQGQSNPVNGFTNQIIVDQGVINQGHFKPNQDLINFVKAVSFINQPNAPSFNDMQGNPNQGNNPNGFIPQSNKHNQVMPAVQGNPSQGNNPNGFIPQSNNPTQVMPAANTNFAKRPLDFSSTGSTAQMQPGKPAQGNAWFPKLNVNSIGQGQQNFGNFVHLLQAFQSGNIQALRHFANQGQQVKATFNRKLKGIKELLDSTKLSLNVNYKVQLDPTKVTNEAVTTLGSVLTVVNTDPATQAKTEVLIDMNPCNTSMFAVVKSGKCLLGLNSQHQEFINRIKSVAEAASPPTTAPPAPGAAGQPAPAAEGAPVPATTKTIPAAAYTQNVVIVEPMTLEFIELNTPVQMFDQCEVQTKQAFISPITNAEANILKASQKPNAAKDECSTIGAGKLCVYELPPKTTTATKPPAPAA